MICRFYREVSMASLIQLFQCMRGKHERSRGKARQDDDAFRSECRGCGKPMLRTPRGWIIDTGDGANAV
jgi:hypothetical protein